MVAPMMPRPQLPTALGPPPLGVQPGNPVELLASLKQLVGTPVKAPEPIYRPGYAPPPRPDPQKVRQEGKRLYESGRLWRNLIFNTLRWTRQDLTGMFPEDELDRLSGFQEEYVSSALSDERNLVISKGSAFKPSFLAPPTTDSLRGWSQKLEDGANWLRKMEAFNHVAAGNRPLELDEWALFADYGMYAARSTFDKDAPDCPIVSVLIDPTQVYPVYAKRRLSKVYRVYTESIGKIVEAYGDLTNNIYAKLKQEKGSELGSDTEIEVVEYWDTWWRVVLVGGDVLIPVTAHKYGDVPWTVQYGGFGEPMFTRSMVDAAVKVRGEWVGVDANRNDERIAKSVPYLYYRVRGHSIYEAVMARVLTGFKKDINPPTIRYRSDLAAEKPMPQLDASAGAQNEAMLNEERIEAFPTVNAGTTQIVLGALQQDKERGSAPPQMYGQLSQRSNVTGAAQAEANDAGMHLLHPMVKAYEAALTQKTDRELRMLGNFGHLATYGGDTKRPIVVPMKRRGPQSAKAYEFDREVIEQVGSRVEVSITRVDPRDWPGMIAAATPGIEAGIFLRRDIRALATGDTDYDTFYEEWQEEQSLFMAQSLPEFQKLNVMASIVAQIKENEGRPDVVAGLMQMLQLWQQIAVPPQQPQQPGMGQPQGGMPPPGPPQGGGMPLGPQQPQGPMQGPFPPPPGGMQTGAPGGAPYAQMGQGPGSQGAPVGRPSY